MFTELAPLHLQTNAVIRHCYFFFRGCSFIRFPVLLFPLPFNLRGRGGEWGSCAPQNAISPTFLALATCSQALRLPTEARLWLKPWVCGDRCGSCGDCKAAFTRQTVVKHVGKLLATNRTCLYSRQLFRVGKLVFDV